MAIIYTYPIVIPTSNDLVLGTDVDAKGKPTKNFTIQSIIDLVTVSGNDLQAVLNNGNTATQNIILTGNISATQYTDGTMSIVGGVGTGFSSITSTDFAGNLTGIVKAGSSIEGTVTGVTQNQGDNSTKLATTAYVDGQVDPSILQYLGDSTGPFDLNLVNDDFKITGTANQIETTATAVAGNVGVINLKFPTAGVVLPDGSTATTQAASDDSTKVATTAFVRDYDDLQDLDFTTGSGSGSVLLNSQTLTLSGTTNQITTSGSGQTATFALASSITISGTYTGTTFSGDLNGTINTATTGVTQNAGDDSTKIATTAYVDNAAGAKTLDYAGDATGPFTLNLSTDDLEFNGDSNISVSAAAVTANKGIVTIDLNNDVTITGTMKADTFTTTAGTATWVTTILDGFTSITSTAFVGALTGNATTATALASAGALSFGGEVTLSSSTPSPATYTSGGNIILNLGLNNAAVIGKVLTGLSVPATGNSIEPDDSILSAFGKLQAQHNTSVNGLRYIGTWDARTQAEGGAAGDEGNPALADGGGVITTGTNTSVVADQLVDSTKNFTTLGVAIGERVYNQAGAFTTVSAVGTTTLTLNEDIFLTNGQTYSVDNNPALNQGEYYVVNQAGTVDLNGNASWAVGDWVIAGAGNTWEKLDQTGVDGTGSINRIPRWDTVSSLNDSIILQDNAGIKIDTGKTLTTQGTGGSLSVGGDATISGLTTASAALSLTGGVNLPTGAYGAANQVLGNANAAGGAGNDLVWITPTVGEVVSITGDYGITVAGTAAVPTIAVTADTNNLINQATAKATPVGADTVLINDSASTPANALKKATLTSIKTFTAESWLLDVDGGTAATISDGDQVGFNSGTGIIQTLSTKDITTAIDYVGNNNAIEAAADGTSITVAATDKLWVSDADDNTIKQINVSQVSGVVDQNLAEVLAVNNVTGGTDIAVSANDDITLTNSSKILLGGTDLQIYSAGATDSHIKGPTSGNLKITSDILTLSKSDNTSMLSHGGEAVSISYRGSTNPGVRFLTTTTGIEVMNADVNGAPTILLNQDSKNFIITQSVTGGGQITNSFGSLALRNDGSIILQNKAGTDFKASFDSNISFSPDNLAGTATVPGVTIYQSTDTTADGTRTRVYGDLQVDGNIIHEGGGGGIFYGDQAISTGSSALTFTLKRATTGTLMFDVWFTSETSTATSVAKKYVVAHSSNTTPVYNKILDTGPDGSNDFTVTFANATGDATGDSVTCSIQAVGVAQNIGYTVQVGHDSTNALTFTAAS